MIVAEIVSMTKIKKATMHLLTDLCLGVKDLFSQMMSVGSEAS